MSSRAGRCPLRTCSCTKIIEGEGQTTSRRSCKGSPFDWRTRHSASSETKVAHAFLNNKDPVVEHEYIIAERLGGGEQAGTRRSQARYVARRMRQTEFWVSGEQG